jgi:hypothetical protein
MPRTHASTTATTGTPWFATIADARDVTKSSAAMFSSARLEMFTVEFYRNTRVYNESPDGIHNITTDALKITTIAV